MPARSFDISHKTIFFVASFLALLWALYLIKDVIILLFIAIIFMSALSPIIDKLESWKIPKALAIAFTYVVVFSLLGFLVSIVITPLIEQTSNLVTNLPQTLNKLFPDGSPIDKSVIQRELGNISGNALGFSLAVFSNFLAFISVAVLTFYLLLQRERLDQLISQFFVGQEERVKKISRRIEDKLGAWLRGQLVLSFIIGSVVYIVLFFLNVPYAIPLAILAGIMEVIPVIGPIISAIPAVMIAYVSSPILALIVAGAFFVIQQLENHIIVPQVMKKAVGLNPLIVILAVSIGGKLLGVAGALLAVPVAVVVQIITEGVLKEE
ncbi:MAG: protein of unknown function UPF0118 [uncultured bacterium]|uniref:AI-2E family transporter n=3 Tax=Candidatus Daviesiibacteriota TaxID=1752718 RepID=A0A1F5K1N3_9BACT|nr:MAG: protein of unknown function UPF0118 [uncultured bacterium]KKQ15360.1 MAG: hypothetical protein US28_C0018G0006 [Candidatus Daviesbacteria bacterium GW2011_GWA1_36_8]OGE16607.1 MAG: hypothetical protein A2858_02055 [Candidatus Daviesbacteria bacterium RIFCSPHIGHO2_01_FULL_36_37]OGE33676.1 MAG: hypothetical protein A3C99_02180 [Candidatus Daviesbacteria bacterium RIFCSPHIGHO2_02_FULL_37_9]OGE34690.1 MAG: hypothetical protein A3E66_03615 [Candidatus Daviesbacteria bacterium RIFCSPHIGHO2_12